MNMMQGQGLAAAHPARRLVLSPVQRALSWPDVPRHDMGVHLGGLHICMAEQFLEHADVDPVLQHMGRKTVAQGMAADLLVEPCLLYSSFHRLLQAGFAHVMTHLPAR